MRTLRRFAFAAYRQVNHSLRGCNFGIYAQSGQGKTYVVKQFAKTIGVPFVMVQSMSLNDTATLFQMIVEECEDTNPIVPYSPDGSTDYTLPPMIVFFDEAHALPTKMMTGGLLNAMEPDDGVMMVKQGRSGVVTVDCSNVCWIGATTEKGKLFDAFANRLSTDIEWRSGSPGVVAQIVSQKMNERAKTGEITSALPPEACQLAAHYRQVPREAISFGVRMSQQRDMFPSDTWEDAARQIAQDMGLDEWGFSNKQIAILKAVGQRPTAMKHMETIARCRLEQVERYELPMLMDYCNGGPFVLSNSRGLCITEAGLRELEKRGIPHRGEKVTVEYFESK